MLLYQLLPLLLVLLLQEPLPVCLLLAQLLELSQLRCHML